MSGSQFCLMPNSREGKGPRPESFACRIRSSTRGRGPLEEGLLPDGGAGDERLVAPPVASLEQGQQRPG